MELSSESFSIRKNISDESSYDRFEGGVILGEIGS